MDKEYKEILYNKNNINLLLKNYYTYKEIATKNFNIDLIIMLVDIECTYKTIQNKLTNGCDFILKRYMEGYSQTAIAQEMGVSTPRVNFCLKKIKKMFLKELNKN